MTKTYQDVAMAAIHETAAGLHKIGILDKQTMREFDELCLTPIRPMTGADIRACASESGSARRCLPAT